MMSDTVATRLLESSEKAPSGAGRALRMPELYTRLTQAVWSELDGSSGDIAPLRREVQRDHVNRIAAQLIRPGSSSRADTRSTVRGAGARAARAHPRCRPTARPERGDPGPPGRQRRHAGAGDVGPAAAQRRLKPRSRKENGRPRAAVERRGGRRGVTGLTRRAIRGRSRRRRPGCRPDGDPSRPRSAGSPCRRRRRACRPRSPAGSAQTAVVLAA